MIDGDANACGGAADEGAWFTEEAGVANAEEMGTQIVGPIAAGLFQSIQRLVEFPHKCGAVGGRTVGMLLEV